MTLTLITFIACYSLFVFFPHWRTIIALLGAVLIILSGTVSPKEAFFFINWNVLAIFLGTLLLAEVFMESRAPAYLAEKIVNRSKNTAWAILFICLLTGLISAFVENVATVLIVAPVAFALARRLNINPKNMLIAIAISSNLQGTATLVGDPPSMLLAGFAKLNFLDFFFYHNRPGIFFAVELGALASFLVLYFVFRKHRGKGILLSEEKVKSWVPAIMLLLLIFLLAAASFSPWDPTFAAGIICLIVGFCVLLWEKVKYQREIWRRIRSLDWDTALFLAAIFILVGALAQKGWVDRFALFLSNLVGINIFWGYTLLVFLSVFFSAFVDNVPYLMAMLPVTSFLAQRLNVSPSLFLFGLLIGASLGGNITPIGASANIVACGLLKKEGYPVRFGEFVKIGLPFTLAAVGTAYLFIWFVWR